MSNQNLYQVFLMVHGLAGVTARAARDMIEGVLARVQIMHKCFIVHIQDARDAAERIVNLTGDLAVRPYKYVPPLCAHLPSDRVQCRIIQMTYLPFAPDLVTSCGRGEKETYVHMLAQIPSITVSNAKVRRARSPRPSFLSPLTSQRQSLAAKYPTFDALIGALENARSAREREDLIVGLPLEPGKPDGRKFGIERVRHLIQLLLAEDLFATVG